MLTYGTADVRARDLSDRFALPGGKGERRVARAAKEAKRQQARSLGLRAATSLARPWRDQERRGEARDLLAPV